MQMIYGLDGVLGNAAAKAAWAQQLGFDAVATSETAHDPYLPLAVAAQAAPGLSLQTRVAIAFARSPMLTASAARELHVLTGGRFVLGLGTQIRPHIRRRFGMPWSGRPAAQMREYVAALHAIWRDWEGVEPLAFRGEHYEFTLMTDAFRPGRSDLPPPPVHLAAVGPLMTRLAGEICDGLIPHTFSTSAWFKEVTLPAVRQGLDRAGRTPAEFVVHCPGMVVVTAGEPTEEQRRQIRTQVAFYGSTPAYGEVLRFHDWGALHEELHRMSLTDDPQRWERMTDLVDDEVLGAFSTIGPIGEVCAEVAQRFGGDIDLVHLHPPLSTTAAEIAHARQILSVRHEAGIVERPRSLSDAARSQDTRSKTRTITTSPPGDISEVLNEVASEFSSRDIT